MRRDAVALALSFRRAYATLLAARTRSFNFRIASYGSTQHLQDQMLVSSTVSTVKGIDLDPEHRGEHSIINLIGGKSLHFEHLYTMSRILNIDPPSVFAPLIANIGNKLRTIDTIRQRLDASQISFPEYSLEATLMMKYAPLASDHRPFYRLTFHLEAVVFYKGEEEDDAGPIYEHTTVARGHFRDPCQPIDKINSYLTQLWLLSSEEAEASFTTHKML